MKSIVIKAGNIQMEERIEPVISTGEVLVQVNACGLSREDLLSLGELGSVDGFVIGREVCGVVKKVADDAFKSLLERKVILIPYQNCRICECCRSSRESMCDELRTMGVYDAPVSKHALDGGAAQMVRVTATMVLPVGSDVPDEQLCCVHIFAVALAASHKAQMIYSEDAAILGNGTVGLALIPVLNALGAKQVIYIDADDSNRQIAKRMGAAACIAPKKEDMKGIICRTVFDTLCTSETQRLGIGLLREKGTMINLALGSEGVEYVLSDLNGERCICNVTGASVKDYYDVLKMMEMRRLSAEQLVGEIFKLVDYHTALKRLKSGVAHVVLTP